jgi:alpha-N-acetylglucosaminidase
VLDDNAARVLAATACWYDPVELGAAWGELSAVASAHPHLLAAELGHDLVSVAATAMVRACDVLLVDAVAAWRRARGDFAAAADRFLRALDDLDALLSIRPELQLATWEAAAAAHSHDPASRSVLVDNARRIVSVWITSRRLELEDYSARLWAGLVGGLYRPRWRAFVDELTTALDDARAPDPDALTRRITAVTGDYIAGLVPRAPATADEPLVLLRRLLETYGR